MGDLPATVFVTKQALTTGIKEAEVRGDAGHGYLYVSGFREAIARTDYGLTREEAVQQAMIARDKKVVALKRQLARFERMSFEDILNEH